MIESVEIVFPQRLGIDPMAFDQGVHRRIVETNLLVALQNAEVVRRGIAANHAIGFCAKRPSPIVQLNESKWRFLRIAAWPMSRRYPTDTCPSSYAPPSQIGQFKVNFRRLRAPATNSTNDLVHC